MFSICLEVLFFSKEVSPEEKTIHKPGWCPKEDGAPVTVLGVSDKIQLDTREAGEPKVKSVVFELCQTWTRGLALPFTSFRTLG